MKKEYRVTIKVDLEKVKEHGIIGDPDDEWWSAEDNIQEAIEGSLRNTMYQSMDIEVVDVRYDDYVDPETPTGPDVSWDDEMN